MTDAPLTIGMPTSTFLPALGGVEVGLHNIAARLAARGHTPIVVTPAFNARALHRAGTNLPYKVVSLPPKTMTLIRYWPEPGTRFVARWLDRLDRRHNFDAWHGTVGFPIGVSLIRAAAGRRPHLVRCAGDDIQVVPEIGYGMRLDPRVDRLVREWLPRADILVAITRSVADEYTRLGIPQDRVRHIPNGVDIGRFEVAVDRGAVRRRLGLPEQDFLFLAVGRNHPKKGYADLLRAVRLLGEHGRTDFAVAVAGSSTEQLADAAARQGVSDRIHLLGALGAPSRGGDLDVPGDDLVELYRAADGFVFPSHIETFGIALVEAMAAGLPVITTDGPGCRDIAEGGTYADMVPVADVGALADAMARFLDHPGHVRDRIAQSRARAKAFSWDRIVDEYIDVYRDGIARHASERRNTS